MRDDFWKAPGEGGCTSASREGGFSLLELGVAFVVLTTVLLAVGFTLLRSTEHQRETFNHYLALSALRDLAAEIQETANAPQNLTELLGIGAVYARYHGKSFPVASLPSGSITVTCYADEKNVPAELGGPQDLNFDGDAEDDLTPAAYDLKLVPLALELTYEEKGEARSLALYRLVTKTTD